MSLAEIEAAAKVGWWTGTRILYAAVGLGVFILLMVVGYYIFVKPGKDALAISTANGQATVSAAGADAAQEAIGVIDHHNQGEVATQATTRDHYVYIKAQPGASDHVNPALLDAFRKSICVYKSASRLPRCVQLLGHGAQ